MEAERVEELTIRNERIGNDYEERSRFLHRVEVREEADKLTSLSEALSSYGKLSAWIP